MKRTSIVFSTLLIIAGIASATPARPTKTKKAAAAPAAPAAAATPAPAATPTPAAPADGAKPAEGDDAGRVGEALKALAAAKDAEALKIMEGAQANGGRVEMTPEQARALVKRAKEQGLIAAKAEHGELEQDAKLAASAIQLLAQKGDAQAKELLEKAAADGGRLQMTTEEMASVLKKAKEQGLLSKVDGVRVGKAISALAQQGDAEAQAKLDAAKNHDGRLEITPEEAGKFVDKAKAAGLIE